MPREHSRWVAVAQTFCAGRSPSLRPRSGLLQGPRDGFDDGEEDAAADTAADDLPHDRAEIKTAGGGPGRLGHPGTAQQRRDDLPRSEEHTSELQSLMRISSAVFCLKK